MAIGRGSSPNSEMDVSTSELPVRRGSSDERAEIRPSDTSAAVGFLRTRTDETNRVLIEDALRRIRPVFGSMRPDGSYCLGPTQELDGRHMAGVISAALGLRVEEVVPASRESFVFPAWVPGEDRDWLFERSVMPDGRDLDSLVMRMQSPESPIKRDIPANVFIWPDEISDVRDAVTVSMGDFSRNAPEHLSFTIGALLVRYLDACLDADAQKAALLAPLIDRLPQFVPIRSLDEDGRRWLVRVA